MHVVICGSMSASKGMLEAQQELMRLGHTVTIPQFTEEYANLDKVEKKITESARRKVEHDLIKGYFEKIGLADAVVVVNLIKNGTNGYIGANAFLEMGFAHVQGKKIFLLNDPAKSWHADEIEAMKPVVLRGDFSKLK